MWQADLNSLTEVLKTKLTSELPVTKGKAELFSLNVSGLSAKQINKNINIFFLRILEGSGASQHNIPKSGIQSKFTDYAKCTQWSKQETGEWSHHETTVGWQHWGLGTQCDGWVVVVEFILLGIPWDSLICEFLSFTQFGTFLGILSSNISFCTYVSFYLLG